MKKVLKLDKRDESCTIRHNKSEGIELAYYDFETGYEKLLDETKAVLINPKFIWEIGNLELKHLLLGVCFGAKIYYTKNQGLQTPEIPLIYRLSGQLSGNKRQDLEIIGSYSNIYALRY